MFIKKSIARLLILLMTLSPALGAMAGELTVNEHQGNDCTMHAPESTGTTLCKVDCVLAICAAFHISAAGLIDSTHIMAPPLQIDVMLEDASPRYISQVVSLLLRPPKS